MCPASETGDHAKPPVVRAFSSCAPLETEMIVQGPNGQLLHTPDDASRVARSPQQLGQQRRLVSPCPNT